MPEAVDVAVIGAGPGGYVAALRARQLGLTVSLVEKGALGGVCLNRGCIPTKALLADAAGFLWARSALKEGIIEALPSANLQAMIRRKDAVVDRLVSGLGKLLSEARAEIVNGTASILEPGVVAVSGKQIAARNIIIATGSRPWVPPIPGTDLPGVLSTREILSLKTLPQSLIIVGGGIIGQEFAALFSALGCHVTVLEALDRILIEVDAELAKRFASLLPGRGVKIETSVRIKGIEQVGSQIRVVFEKKGNERTAQADVILMATGRRPNFEELGLAKLGIAVENSAIKVDRFLGTSIPGIYAIGDVTGRKMLAHVASYHGEVATENIAGRQRPVEEIAVPACVFTSPQIAWVGLTEEQAVHTGRPFRTSTFALAASGKALAEGESRGIIKLIEDGLTRRLVGVHLMGPHVSELIGEATLILAKGMSASDLCETIHPHPTISEALREAALGLRDGPIHAPSRIRTVGMVS